MRTQLIALATAAALPLLALGQTSQPGASGGTGQNGVGSPFWQSEPSIEYVQRGPDGLPLTLVEQVPRVEYLYGISKWSFRTAQSDQIRLIDRKRDQMQSMPAFADAVRSEREAWSKYQQARAEVLDRLMDDTEYAALVRVQRQVELQIEDARGGPNADMQYVADLAESKLAYSRQITAYQRGALDANEDVDAARRVFLEAGENLRDMRREIETALANDPEIAHATNMVKQLRIEFLAMSRFRNATERAADRALAFARFSRRVDRFRPVSETFGFGFGRGFGNRGFGFGNRGFGPFSYGGGFLGGQSFTFGSGFDSGFAGGGVVGTTVFREPRFTRTPSGPQFTRTPSGRQFTRTPSGPQFTRTPD
ncbi:MAG: hypothetical protein AAGD32_09420 [Planctomycetota bacterium]